MKEKQKTEEERVVAEQFIRGVRREAEWWQRRLQEKIEALKKRARKGGELSMTDVPKEVEAIAKQMWEWALKETAKVMGIAGEQSDKLIAVQMRYIRDMVAKIDAGEPGKGNA
jgi:hypothetical protein